MADVLPLPNPALDAARSLFGETSDTITTHDYRDAAGNLLFAAVFGYGVRRYMRREGDVWVKCRRPALCPLYRLPQITRSEVADVWLVPDERDADRLTRLGLLASRLPAKDTDIAPLAERALVLWGGVLTGGDATSIQRNATVKRLAAITSRLTIVDPGLDLPNVWFGDHPDATRAHIADLPTVTLADLRRRKQVPHRQIMPTAEVPSLADGGGAGDVEKFRHASIKIDGDRQTLSTNNVSFQVSKDGVFAYAFRRDGRVCETRICSELRVLAKTCNRNETGWGIFLEWKDPRGKIRRLAVSRDDFEGDGTRIRRALIHRGLEIMPGKQVRDRLEEYLLNWPAEKIMLCTDKIGWCGDLFVLPDRVIAGPKASEEVIYQSDVDNHPMFAQAGTLTDWRTGIARLCAGNSRLVFGLSCAFAGPLLRFCGQRQGGGFNLHSTTSRGKTSTLQIIASVFGPPEYVRGALATQNSIEAMGAAHNDCVLLLDELGHLPKSEDAGRIAYLLANGRPKGRSKKDGGERKQPYWRTLFLTSSELTLAEKAAEDGNALHGGHEVRLCDIPAEVIAGWGVIETLHGYERSGDLVDALVILASEHYGTAGIAWIEWLTKRIDAIPEQIDAEIRQFTDRHMPANAPAPILRVTKRFAIVAAAGELATCAGLTGWNKGEAFAAVAKCYGAWLNAQGKKFMNPGNYLLDNVRQFLERNLGRFGDWDDKDLCGRLVNPLGFRRKIGGSNRFEPVRHEWLIFPSGFAELCQAVGRSQEAVARTLEANQWLIPGNDGRPSKVVWGSPLGTKRFYCLSPAALEDPS